MGASKRIHRLREEPRKEHPPSPHMATTPKAPRDKRIPAMKAGVSPKSLARQIWRHLLFSQVLIDEASSSVKESNSPLTKNRHRGAAASVVVSGKLTSFANIAVYRKAM